MTSRLLAATLWILPVATTAAADEPRPNVVWIVVEDMSAHFGCYGEKTIETPHVDRMAKEGVRFSRAYVTAPVCSTCRSALVTGTYQTAIGAHHHRSGRGSEKIELPAHVELIPRLFQRAGYHTSNCSWPPRNKISKTDYNFEWDPAVYDSGNWADRKPGQPFFTQIQLRGGKLRGHGDGDQWPATVKKTLGSVTKPEDVTLPPYYPRDEVLLEDWAQYLDTCRYTDHEVGQILDRLKSEGVLDNTYVFFLTDHGVSHVRGKQFCYEEGMHVPLVVRGPGLEAGTVRDDLVVHVDLAASSLAFAGIEVPEHLQSVDLFASDYQPRKYVVSARDRCDETVDRIRGVRTARYKYIRNFHPQRPYLQPNAYKDNKPIVRRMRELFAAGTLNEAQSLQMAETRPPEELYDLESDPWELRNLAEDPAHAETLAEHRGHLAEWIEKSGDRGRTPEPASMYDSDMAVYLKALRTRRPERLKEIQANIDLMKKWAAEGK